MKRIFISYRRADTAHFAGRVFDRLRHHVGSQNVFMDVDNIPLGVDFAQYIGDEISKCDVMLALIGPNWVDVLAKNGTGRLDDQQDFVRIEIALALRRNIPVVPILLEGTMMPSANRLPDDLRPLAQRNALSVRHSSFHSDMDKLVRELDLTLAHPTPIHLDIAEQLVAQVQQWFEALASDGNTPRAFSGVIRDATQFSLSLEGLSLNHVKRRDFLIWLCAEYDVVAYAYATPVIKQKAIGSEDFVEALDLYSSSFHMDVSASLRIIRRPDGIVHYARDSYVAQEAMMGDPGQIFWGLHRIRHYVSSADSEKFSRIWAAIGPRVRWQRR